METFVRILIVNILLFLNFTSKKNSNPKKPHSNNQGNCYLCDITFDTITTLCKKVHYYLNFVLKLTLWYITFSNFFKD